MTLVLTFVGDWAPELRQTAERALGALQEVVAGEGEVNLGAAGAAGHSGSNGLPYSVNVKLVDDDEIASLNKEYTGNAYPTDVLTFPYRESGITPEGELADIAISVQMAARQAAKAGTKLADEVGLLVAHGLLHALGYDHATQTDRRHFERLQQRILQLADITYRDFQWQ